MYCHDGWGTGNLDVGLSNGSGFNTSSWGQVCGSSQERLSTGDFNGDGKTDFLCKPDYGGLSVGLSSGSGLTWTGWTPGPWCKLNEGAVIAGDFNGDGKTDLVCHYVDSYGANVGVKLSTGSAFVDSGQGLTDWCRSDGTSSWGEDWGATPKAVLPGDFDGDGNTDLLCRSLSGSTGKWVALANGTGGFVHDGRWLGGFCIGEQQYGLGDFNGDGKTDLYCYKNWGPSQTNTVKVALSDGGAFEDKGEWLASNVCKRLSVGDMNGDGRADLWCFKHDTDEHWVGLSDGSSGFSDWQLWRDNWCSGTSKVFGGDFNGDGKTDMACHTSTESLVGLSGAVPGKTDLLTSVHNPLGGVTTIAYTPGTQWSNTEVPPPAEVSVEKPTGEFSTTPSTHPLSPGGPTVVSVTVADGRGGSSTTTYSYSGGLYDEVERKWFGYQNSNEVRPKLPNETAAPHTLSLFRQDAASAGARYYHLDYDGLERELAAVYDDVFIGSGDGETEPYTAKVVSRTHYLLDGSGIDCTAWPCTHAERRYEEYDYDPWGNKIETRSWGNYDFPDDETTTTTEFYPNTNLYLVNKPARTTTYYGIGTAGAKLTDVEVYYDGATAYNQSPTAGLPTNQLAWLNTETRFVAQCPDTECTQYDPYGNVSVVKKTEYTGGAPVSAATTFDYDTTYHKFPSSVTNPLGQVMATPQWNVLCEAPETLVDPNQQQITTSYDALCRHDRTDGPLGSFIQSVYSPLEDPNGQYTEVETPSADGTGVY